MIRVLVADDQDLIRAGLVALIRTTPEFEVVGTAATGEQAIAEAAVRRPDVVLMDVRMPGIGGIAATRRIAVGRPGGAPPPKVIMLTTFDLDEYVYGALRAGAAGFLLKDTGPERMLAAIATVAAGDMLFAPAVMRRLVETYLRGGSDGGLPTTLDELTSRETEVLRHVGQGLSNGDIAARLVLSEATVKTHLNRSMTKLGLSSRAQAVVVAYEAGLVTPRQPAPPRSCPPPPSE